MNLRWFIQKNVVRAADIHAARGEGESMMDTKKRLEARTKPVLQVLINDLWMNVPTTTRHVDPATNQFNEITDG